MGVLTNKQLRRLVLLNVVTPSNYYVYRKLLIVKKERHYTRRQFNIHDFTEEECLTNFRFGKKDLQRLATALNLPVMCTTGNRLKFSAMEGLCILLQRLCYPNRLRDLVKTFNRDFSAISRIFTWTLHYIYCKYKHLLSTLDQPWLSTENLHLFAYKCSAAGSILPNICGFIDGTARPICRPKYIQRELYSGYKKLHCIKFQSIMFPNGLIGRLDGPYIGRRHDAAILNLSKLIIELRTKFLIGGETTFRLYGDPGYSNSRFIFVGYKQHERLNAFQKYFNKTMSALRVSVEYGFGKILQLFAFNDFRKNNKIFLQPLKKQYIVSAILANCHTCLKGSQVSDYFDCLPPSIEEYLYQL